MHSNKNNFSVSKASPARFKKCKIGIVVSTYHQTITNRLLYGAHTTLTNHGVKDLWIKTIWVPGAFELPLGIKRCLEDKKSFDACIALGVVVQGSTHHHQEVTSACTQGILQLTLQYGKPIGFGVLSVKNIGQAEERSNKNRYNKGQEAAEAVLNMLA